MLYPVGFILDTLYPRSEALKYQFPKPPPADVPRTHLRVWRFDVDLRDKMVHGFVEGGTPREKRQEEAEELRALADALHEREMWLMVDVVANHLGSTGQEGLSVVESWEKGVKEGRYGPFDRLEDFHPFCRPTDWDVQEQIEQCES